jgi:hypothetical protein
VAVILKKILFLNFGTTLKKTGAGLVITIVNAIISREMKVIEGGLAYMKEVLSIEQQQLRERLAQIDVLLSKLV